MQPVNTAEAFGRDISNHLQIFQAAGGGIGFVTSSTEDAAEVALLGQPQDAYKEPSSCVTSSIALRSPKRDARCDSSVWQPPAPAKLQSKARLVPLYPQIIRSHWHLSTWSLTAKVHDTFGLSWVLMPREHFRWSHDGLCQRSKTPSLCNCSEVNLAKRLR